MVTIRWFGGMQSPKQLHVDSCKKMGNDRNNDALLTVVVVVMAFNVCIVIAIAVWIHTTSEMMVIVKLFTPRYK